jgi:hypothetical protein
MNVRTFSGALRKPVLASHLVSMTVYTRKESHFSLKFHSYVAFGTDGNNADLLASLCIQVIYAKQSLEYTMIYLLHTNDTIKVEVLRS